MATVKTSTDERTPEYTVRLTPEGEQYVQEEAARRTLAKLATAAELFVRAEQMAGDWRGDEWKSWLQRERGLCSEPDCDEPIAGWCATCDAGGPFKAPKWCAAHLRTHLAAHRGHVPYWRYDPDGGAA